jgi:hypothetical protein
MDLAIEADRIILGLHRQAAVQQRFEDVALLDLLLGAEEVSAGAGQRSEPLEHVEVVGFEVFGNAGMLVTCKCKSLGFPMFVQLFRAHLRPRGSSSSGSSVPAGRPFDSRSEPVATTGPRPWQRFQPELEGEFCILLEFPHSRTHLRQPVVNLTVFALLVELVHLIKLKITKF